MAAVKVTVGQAHDAVLFVTARTRGDSRLDDRDELPDPSLAALVAAVPEGVGTLWLDGGEPTLRPDLPALLAALEGRVGSLGLVTDGRLLARERTAHRLAALGVAAVRLRVHTARPDAQDWLTGQSKALAAALMATACCRKAGIEVQWQATVTRPTQAHLAEWVQLARRREVGAVRLVRLTARGAAASQQVAVMPRLGLMGPDLDEALAFAERVGLAITLHGIPACTSRRASAFLGTSERVLLPREGAWAFAGPRFGPVPQDAGCDRCSLHEACPGIGRDYVRRFGRDEIDTASDRRRRPGVTHTPLAGGEVEPPPRAGRTPPVRLGYVRACAALPSLGGDPLSALVPGPVPDRIRAGWSPDESTREVRRRLVRLAQERPQELWVEGEHLLAHPEAADLIRETTRLSIPRVVLVTECAALAGFTSRQLRRLQKLAEVRALVWGPDVAHHDAHVGTPGALDAALAGLAELHARHPRILLGWSARSPFSAELTQRLEQTLPGAHMHHAPPHAPAAPVSAREEDARVVR